MKVNNKPILHKKYFLKRQKAAHLIQKKILNLKFLLKKKFGLNVQDAKVVENQLMVSNVINAADLEKFQNEKNKCFFYNI